MLPSLFARLIQSAIAHVYPAYRSYQALQRGDSGEISSWLTYWTVLGVFHTTEVATDFFVWWVPFYDELKILTILWLVFPSGQGAGYLYQTYLRPCLTQHRETIEEVSSRVFNRIQSGLGFATADFANRINNYIRQLAENQPNNAAIDFEDIPSSATKFVNINNNTSSDNSPKKR